jgi:tricorn protease interacting factor F2/3
MQSINGESPMTNCHPVNYKIHLEPDLANFTFAGTAEILFEAQNSVKEIVLDLLEIDIGSCQVMQTKNAVDCAFKFDSDKEKLRIVLPEPMSGNIKLTIDYQGLINDKMAGFYRSKYAYQDQTGYMAVTQFEESDARRAFPCMDHPARKATFDIAMDIDPHLVAISNGVVKEKLMLDSGKIRVTFDQTPKMSTYLVFFGVGEFEFTPDEKDDRVRVVTLPGMQKFAHFGADLGRKSLEFSEDYYGIAYPLPKMDLIAIPDFAFGAMENWGAVTFRENLLLHYPEVTSKFGEERIFEVIAHEIAHQWFGNLVTPSDWRYLWLNESFATFFGFGVVAHYCPEWDTWQQFLYSMTGPAMARDALHETFAIEIPGGEHVVINASTAPIIYNKGGSILRQIQGYIGKDNFKKGLRHYLKTFEYKCAASRDLWQSFETVTQQPISELMQSWIEQPGYPKITVRRKNGRLILNQQRFTYLPEPSAQRWMIPVTVNLFTKSGETRKLSLIMDDAEKELEIEEDVVAYKVNDQQSGFYRVKYDDAANLAELGRQVLVKTMSPEDRWGLQNDLYALVKSGEVSLVDYLKFLSSYRQEDAYLPLVSIADNLLGAYLITDEDLRGQIATMAAPWFEAILHNIGFEPDKAETHTISLLRDKFIWAAAFLGSDAAVEFARDRFKALMEGADIHPDIMKSVLQASAYTGDERVYNWFVERMDQSRIEHERMNILTALGCFKDGVLTGKVLQSVLDSVPARNKFIPVVAMSANPYAIPLMWDWYVSHLEEIEQFHPMLYERIVAAIIPASGLERADEVKKFFADYMQQKDKARDVIKLSLERLEINLRMRAAN